MKKNYALITALVMTSSLLLSNSAIAGGKGNASAGKKVYEQNCATCHATSGKGDTPIAASLNPKPRNFVEAKFKYGSDDASLHKTIANGKGVMPAWKAILKDKQIDDVIAYIRTFKKK
jgi:cbb3-type cytochrome c oxidase subunit III